MVLAGETAPEVTGMSDNEGGVWHVVRKKATKRASKVNVTYRREANTARAAEDSRRFRAGECFSCGSKGHRKKDCPDNVGKVTADGSKVTAGTTSEARGGHGEEATGQKRSRPAGNSGLTPESKQQRVTVKEKVLPAIPKSKWCYAAAAAPTHEVIFVRLDEEASTEQDVKDMGKMVDVSMLNAIGNGATFLPTIINVSLKPYGIRVEVQDTKSVLALRTIVAKDSYRALTEEEVQEKTKPRKKLSGFIRGPTADVADAGLSLYLKHQKKVPNFNGEMTLLGVARTDKGATLFISVDSEVEEGLAQVDFFLA